MEKKMLAILIAAVMALTITACAKKDEGPTIEDVSDSVIAAADELSLEVVPAAEEGIRSYIEAKEEAAQKKRDKKKKEEEDADDPANADSTAETGKNATKEQMIQTYIGRWEQQGVIQSDGNIDDSTGSRCTYVINADKTYTAKGRDVNGNKIDEKGTWSLNSNKQLVCGDYTLGIDESGYLLKDTGERDGKGRKIKYAFIKVS